MWQYCGIEREEAGLKKGLIEVEEIEKEVYQGTHSKNKIRSVNFGAYPLEIKEVLELKIMLTLCRLILAAALLREETRGHHLRLDFPTSKEQVKHTLIKKGAELRAEPREGEVIRKNLAFWRR